MQIEHKPVEIFDASDLKVGVVVARFNKEITEALLQNALDTLQEYRVNMEDVEIIHVAGSAEIPYALQKLALAKKYHCLVALGCIIRGETAHFEYVCNMAQQGILRVSLDNHLPIGFGVLMTENIAQAEARIHVGGEAAVAALELAKL